MSLEQAYALLLGADSISPEAYFVYSHLMRAGYVVDLHNPDNDYNRLSGFEDQPEMTEDQKIVWTCLQQLLSKSADPLQSNDPHLKATAESMQSIAEYIRKPHSQTSFDRTEFEEDHTTWNTTNSELSSRKRKHDLAFPIEHKNEQFLDKLLDEPNVKGFASIFQQIQVIQLSPLDEMPLEENHTENFEIVFDLFTGNADHRKSDPGPPTHRIVVCPKNRNVPTRQDILRLYTKLSFRTPILVVFVNELMSIQAYVYGISS